MPKSAQVPASCPRWIRSAGQPGCDDPWAVSSLREPSAVGPRAAPCPWHAVRWPCGIGLRPKNGARSPEPSPAGSPFGQPVQRDVHPVFATNQWSNPLLITSSGELQFSSECAAAVSTAEHISAIAEFLSETEAVSQGCIPGSEGGTFSDALTSPRPVALPAKHYRRLPRCSLH